MQKSVVSILLASGLAKFSDAIMLRHSVLRHCSWSLTAFSSLSK